VRDARDNPQSAGHILKAVAEIVDAVIAIASGDEGRVSRYADHAV